MNSQTFSDMPPLSPSESQAAADRLLERARDRVRTATAGGNQAAIIAAEESLHELEDALDAGRKVQ